MPPRRSRQRLDPEQRLVATCTLPIVAKLVAVQIPPLDDQSAYARGQIPVEHAQCLDVEPRRPPRVVGVKMGSSQISVKTGARS